MRSENPRRLLFIAYEFPPSAGGGVQRIASFARLLPEVGWIPHVLTAQPVPGRPVDDTQLDLVEGIEITRLPHRHVSAAIARVGRPLKRLLRKSGGGAGSTSSASVRGPASSRISRGLGFLDDAALWARSVERMAPRLHEQVGFDAVFASGPPFSALVSAVRIGQRIGCPVVTDMRDPWAGNIHVGAMPRRHRDRAVGLERFVAGGAAAATAVSDVIGAELSEFGNRSVTVVPNGFDPTRMPQHEAGSPGPLKMVFIGRLSRASTDPSALFAAFAAARQEEPLLQDATIEFAGPEASWLPGLAQAAGVADAVHLRGYMPYEEALGLTASADVGVILLADTKGAEGIYSGKLFDYMGVGVPILLIGPERGIAAATIREGRLGLVVAYGDMDAIQAAILDLARAKAAGRSVSDPDPTVVGRFDRRTHVAQVGGVLDSVVTS